MDQKFWRPGRPAPVQRTNQPYEQVFRTNQPYESIVQNPPIIADSVYEQGRLAVPQETIARSLEQSITQMP